MTMRYDRAPFKATKTPEGFLMDSPVLSRVGVFPYRQPDGTIRHEFRPPEEVFHVDHLASLRGKPITDDHQGLVTGGNARGKVIGSALSIGRADGDNMLGDLVVHDTAATEGKKDLSLGYSLDLEMTPGEWNGVRYDAIQRNLRVNHIALVKVGRAGNARLNLDAADAVIYSQEEKPTMNTVPIRLDSGLEYQAVPEVAMAVTTLQREVKDANARADALQAEKDTIAADAEKHKTEIAAARAEGEAAALARAGLVAAATAVGVEVKQDAKDEEIRAAVIKHVRGDSVDLTGKSAAYVEAAFDLAVAEAAKTTKTVAASRKQIRGDANEPPAAKPMTSAQARQDMIDKQLGIKKEA